MPNYNLYRTREGWLSVAALEPHFWQKLLDELDLKTANREDLEYTFLTRTAAAWASERDLPLAAVREAPLTEE